MHCPLLKIIKMKHQWKLASISIVIWLAACSIKNTGTTKIKTVAGPLCLDTSASCAYLAKGYGDDILLSWVKALNDSESVICYAISKNGGKSFDTPVEIT